MTTDELSASTKRSRKSMIVLFSIGFVPLFIAWGMYFFFPATIPSGTTNEGHLILPPIDINTLDLREITDIPDQERSWLLVIPVGDTCSESCKERVYLARQVNVALGKNAERVRRAIIHTTNGAQLKNKLEKDYPGMRHFTVGTGMFEEAFNMVENVTDKVFLVDPNGNVMMYYLQDELGKPLLKDLKHLLKISNIG